MTEILLFAGRKFVTVYVVINRKAYDSNAHIRETRFRPNVEENILQILLSYEKSRMKNVHLRMNLLGEFSTSLNYEEIDVYTFTFQIFVTS